MDHINILIAIIVIEFLVALAIIIATFVIRWFSLKQQKAYQDNKVALKEAIQNVIAQPDRIEDLNPPKELQQLPVILATIEKLDREYEGKSESWKEIRTYIIKKYLLAQINENIFHADWHKRLLGLRSLVCAGELALSLDNIEERLPNLFADEHTIVRFHALRAAVLLMSKKTLLAALNFIASQRELSQSLYYSIFEKVDPKISTYIKELQKEIKNKETKNMCKLLLNINCV